MFHFHQVFEALTGHPPFPWQERLYAQLSKGCLPNAVDIPTGLGKTAIMALWLLARAAGGDLPRRLVYVVDRRAVVDQATDFAEKLSSAISGECHHNLKAVQQGLGLDEDRQLPISTLRGRHVDNQKWLEDPSSPAIIVGTVDMIGSRLLFEGYGVSRRMRPYMAGLLGCDTLVLLDEAHLARPFQQLLYAIQQSHTHVASETNGGRSGPERFLCSSENSAKIPRFRVLPLSATLGDDSDSDSFRLDAHDRENNIVRMRLDAKKELHLMDLGSGNLEDVLTEQAWDLFCNKSKGNEATRILVYCNSRKLAEKIAGNLQAKSKSVKTNVPRVILLVGGRRVREREDAAKDMKTYGLIPDGNAGALESVFLVATSAGEVGVDMDADHMVSDLVPWERMVQRLGRVNRRGMGTASVVVVDQGPLDKKDDASCTTHRAVRELLEQLPVAEAGGRWVGPGVLESIGKDTEDVQQRVRAATTETPLYPPLTRPLVDAWSMTSLVEHSGRPEVAPWLRGWVDEEAETTVVWRQYLPLSTERETRDVQKVCVEEEDVAEFFEAASLQTVEFLETGTWQVVEWLLKRAKHICMQIDRQGKNDRRKSDSKVGVASADQFDCGSGTLKPSDVAVLILGADGSLGKHLALGQNYFRLEDITQRKRNVWEAALAGKKLVVDARFRGLRDGLLDASCDDPVSTIEDDWGNAKDVEDENSEDDSDMLPKMRVRKLKESDRLQHVGEHEWQVVKEFPYVRTTDGEVETWLVVEKKFGATDEDSRALTSFRQSLAEHQDWTAQRAQLIANNLNLPQEDRAMLMAAARYHDEGKRTTRWQRAFNAPETGGPYAKTSGPFNRHILNGYRHEFQSTLDAEKQGLGGIDRSDPRFELALHLIASHHGYARPVIDCKGCDSLPPSAAARHANDIAFRFARLQRHWGPWGLAWWESLLRAADQQASRALDRLQKDTEGGS